MNNLKLFQEAQFQKPSHIQLLKKIHDFQAFCEGPERLMALKAVVASEKSSCKVSKSLVNSEYTFWLADSVPLMEQSHIMVHTKE